MGKKSSSPPPAPDPRQVAQAQTGSNIGTAIANAYIGNANEFGPYGSVIYNPTGEKTINIEGQEYQVPQFERVNVLDPAEQGMLDQQRLLGHGLNNLAIGQTGRIHDLLSAPVMQDDILPNRVNQVPTGPEFTAAPEGPGLYGLSLPMMGEGGPIQGSVDMRDAATRLNNFGDPGDIQRSVGPTDFSEDRQKVEEALYSRLNPQLERDRASLENTLINQGYVRGTEAFNRAMDEHTRQANDARMQTVLAGGQEQSRLANLALQQGQFANQAQQQAFGQGLNRGQFYNQGVDQQNAAALAAGQFANAAQQQGFGQDAQRTALNQQGILSETGFNNQAQQQMWQNAMQGMEYDNNLRQMGFGNQMQQVAQQNALREQAMQEQLALRNQPINEITALMSGGQVNVPQFTPYNAPQVGQTPVGNYMYNSAQMDQNNWAQQQQQRSQMMGGLFNLGGMAAYGLLGSDRRLKKAIKRLGVTISNGLNLYSFRYQWDSDRTERVGLMSDEVRQVRPEAVLSLGGYDTVDYTLAMAA